MRFYNKKQLGSISTITAKSSVIYFLIICLLSALPFSSSEAQTNLVVNGDFSLTDPNDTQSPYFNTEYNYNSNLQPEGGYFIDSNPRNHHNNFCNMNTEDKRSPVSGGNMLIANAAGVSKKLWAQFVSVQQNTNYTFSFWAASLANGNNGKSNLLFGLYVDCKRMGNNISNASNCNWEKYTIEINSGSLTNIELAIRNLSAEASGNDIAIDDISFTETESATPFPALTERVWMGYSTDWFNADNWGSCTLPTCGDNIVIPSQGISKFPIIPAGTNTAYKIANVGSITIQPGASLTMGAYSELLVCGNINNFGTINGNSQSQVTLSGSSNQTISGSFVGLKINKSSGSAILNGNVTVSGTLTFSKGLVKTGPYELITTNASTNAVVSHSSQSYVIGNLRRNIVNTGLVVNPSFEHGNSREENPYGWTTNVISGSGLADYTETHGGAKGGSYHLTHWRNASYNIETFQTITGIANGTYTLKAWVKSSAGQTAYMFAKGFNGTTELQNSPGRVDSWKQISISGIRVTNNKCTIGFRSAGSNSTHYFYMDDVEFRPELVANSGFESGMTSWSTTLSSSGTGNEDYTETYGGAYESANHLTHWRNVPYEVATVQNLINLPNGTYTLKAWVKSSGGQSAAYMTANPSNALNTLITSSNIPNTNNNWVQVSLSNIQVTNNRCTIGFYSKAGANQYLYMDQVEFYREEQVTYDFPVGDDSRYQRIQMTMTSNLGINSVLGRFSSEDVTGTAGLPIMEDGYSFDELAKGGYWTLTPDIEPLSSGQYDVEIFLSGIPDANDAVTLAKRHDASSDWTLENSSVVGDYSPRISFKRTGFSTFSDFGLLGAGMIKLPVVLSTFEAHVSESNSVILNWATETESSSHLFVVERSSNALEFIELAKVSAAGNSSSYIEYSSLDNNPFSGINYYRLKQIDVNGAWTYSEIISVSIDKMAQTKGFTLFPNPASTNNVISLILDDQGDVEVSIYNQFGESVSTDAPLKISGAYKNFSLPQLKSGVYLVFVKTNNQVYQEKLIIK